MAGNQMRRSVGLPYGLAQLLDVYEPEPSRASVAVLLWHGSGPNERDVLRPLAEEIANAGVTTVVPDWSRNDGGMGRHHLTASLDFTRDLAARMGVHRIVLAGWSLGASSGLDVVLLTTILGAWCPAGFVGLSGGFDQSPFSETGSLEGAVRPSVPLLLIHGSSDEVVPVDRSRSAFEVLHQRGWEVALREVPTDHAGAIGTIYDPVLHRCVPTDDPVRQEQLMTIARWIADFACMVGQPTGDERPERND